MSFRTLLSSWIVLSIVGARVGAILPGGCVVNEKPLRLRDPILDERGQLAPVNIPLDIWFRGTELQWFGRMQVGTPPQTFTVTFDTGSFDLEIPGISCDGCSNQKQFDPSKSTTFTDLGDGLFLQFATCTDVTPVVDLSCVIVTEEVADTVSVGGLTAPNITIQMIIHQTESFAQDPFDGILGLGADAGTFFQSLIDQGLPPVVSFFLATKASGKQSQLTLGGVDHTKFKGPMTFAPLSDKSGSWNIAITHIFVNGKPVPNEDLSSPLNPNQSFTFDTGTPNLVFSTNLTEAIYELISPDIKPAPNQPVGAYGIACSKIRSLKAVIDFTMLSTDGKPFNLTIPSRELSVGPFDSDPSLCQTLINAQDFGLFFIGGSLLKHYYSTWDTGNARLGFAHTGY